jgi:hypothetical protein
MGELISKFLPVALNLLKDTPGYIKDAGAAIEVGGEIVEGVQKIWSGLTAIEPATADQQAAIDAALLASHEALQNS